MLVLQHIDPRCRFTEYKDSSLNHQFSVHTQHQVLCETVSAKQCVSNRSIVCACACACACACVSAYVRVDINVNNASVG